MKKFMLIVIIITFLTPFFSGNDKVIISLADAATDSILFQNGVNGYNDTEDFIITSLFTNDTEGNGITAKDGYLRVSNQFYEARTIIKFNNIKLPKNAVVIEASLVIVVSDWTGGITIEGYYLNTDWDINSKKLGWKYKNNEQKWTEEGAISDTVQGKSFIVQDFTGEGDQVKTIILDPEIIKGWLNNPSSNYGLIFTMLNNGSSAWIHSSRDLKLNLRPALIIKYKN